MVIFHSGYSDRYLKPFPEDMACMADPLNGKREGWPAPGADAIRYLADRGIRCVATDGPTLGGVDPKRAVMTYWALGSGGMVGVEFLTRVGSMPPKAYFIFAAPRLEGAHGGSGRRLRSISLNSKRGPDRGNYTRASPEHSPASPAIPHRNGCFR